MRGGKGYRRRCNAEMQSDDEKERMEGKEEEEEKKRKLGCNRIDGAKNNLTSRIPILATMLALLVVLFVWVHLPTLQASIVAIEDKSKELIVLSEDGIDRKKKEKKTPYEIFLEANKKKDGTNKKKEKIVLSEEGKDGKKKKDRKKKNMVDKTFMEVNEKKELTVLSKDGIDIKNEKRKRKKKRTAYDLFMEAELNNSSNDLFLSSSHSADVEHNNDQYQYMCAASNNRNIVYSTMRSDRSGSVIQNMLISHAWAFENGFAYGGACPSNNVTFGMDRYGENQQRMKAHLSLLKAMRLDKFIQLKCPSSPTSINAICNEKDYDFIPEIINSKSDSLYSEKYLNELRRIMTHHQGYTEIFQQKEGQMTVHIRRGDVSPLAQHIHARKKYLPNLYYLRLIELYNKDKKYNVTIHSESESFESFDVFCRLGYTVRLDAPLDEVWKDILTSKVIIMSRGHFSLIPSLLSTALFGSNNVTVVQPPAKKEFNTIGKQLYWNISENETFMREVMEEQDRLILLNKKPDFASVCSCCEGNLQMEGAEESPSSSSFQVKVKESIVKAVKDDHDTSQSLSNGNREEMLAATTIKKQINPNDNYNSTNHWWHKYVEEASVIFKPSNNTDWCDMDDYFDSKNKLEANWKQISRKEKSGMYFVKVFKAASSTAAGIALQIAESVFEQKYGNRSVAASVNDDPNIDSSLSFPPTNSCPRHAGHGDAYTRRKDPYFLWTIIREPAKRSISFYFFKQVSRRGAKYDSKKLISQLRRDLNFQIDYIGGQEQLRKKKMNKEMKDVGHRNLDEDVKPTETATNMDAISMVRNIMETFHFIAIADRLDESLVVMKLLFGFIKDENTIVLPSKRSGSGGFDEGRFKGDNLCHRLHKPYTSSPVDEYVASSSYQTNNMDYFLYAVVNRSLDKTIDMLGRDRVEKEVERHRTLQKIAEDRCSDVAIFPCYEDNMPPDSRSQQSCYVGDEGCGHECVKRVIREHNQNQL